MSKKRLKLSEQIRAAVHASGLSQYRICKSLGIDKSLMSKFMRGLGGLAMASLDDLGELLRLELKPTAPQANKGNGKRKAGKQ
jgi:predicted XRE-type DNA-binding protein